MQEERNIFETDISTGGIPKFKFDDFLLPLRLHQVEVRALLTQIEMLWWKIFFGDVLKFLRSLSLNFKTL